MPTTLSTKERAHLKARAHALEPVVQWLGRHRIRRIGRHVQPDQRKEGYAQIGLAVGSIDQSRRGDRFAVDASLIQADANKQNSTPEKDWAPEAIDPETAPRAVRDPLLRSLAEQSSRLPLHKLDACPEEVLNRIIWHAQKGPEAPFPERHAS